MDVGMGEQAWRLADEDDEDISINTRRFPAAVTPARAQLPFTPVASAMRTREPPATPAAQLMPPTPMRSFTTRTPGVLLHEATNILTYSTDRSALRPDDAEENAFAVKQKAFYEEKKKGKANALTLLRLCDDFQRICRDRCEILIEAYPILNSDEGPFPTSAEFLRAQQEFLLLRSERDTWDLLRRLYELRGTDLLQRNTTLPSHATPRDVAQILYHTQSDYRRYNIVLNWLEEISSVPVETSRERVVWRTKDLVRAAQTRLMPASADLVTEVDPDAPLRQSRRLDDGDTEAEQRVVRDVWKLLRAGALADAKQLCRAAGMHWLAAAIGAGPWDDPQLHDEKELASGTQSFDIWLDVCNKIANEEAVYNFERAVFGSLCGNLNAMKLVCASWADQLWASYKHRAHFALQRALQQQRAHFVDMEEFGPAKDGAAVERAAAEPEQAIYDALLRSDTRMEVRREANEPYHVLQGLIITDQIAASLRTLADWAKRVEGGRSICPPQLLRFATHFVLFLDEMRALGIEGAVPSLVGLDDARTALITAYIKHLIGAGHGGWVAFFTARLPESRQVDTYVDYIATLRNTEPAALNRAKEAGLDAKAVALKTAARATSAPVAPVRGIPLAGTGQLTADEEERIRAVEWLNVSPTWLYDFLLQTNKLARAFMLEGRSAAMEALFAPGRLVIADKRNLFEQETLSAAAADPERGRKINACKEHRSYEVYMRAQRAMQEWRKPDGKWTERDHRVFQNAYDSLVDLLTMPGGWLGDMEDAEDEGGREDQLQLIQQRCIPAIAFTLYHLCFEAEKYKESVTLANTIVDQSLQDKFSPDELQQLLRLIGNSVVQLLRSAPDARLPL